MEALVQFGTKKVIITFDNVEEIKNAIEEQFPTLKQLKYRIQVYNSTKVDIQERHVLICF